jgi:hypothetical protein
MTKRRMVSAVFAAGSVAATLLACSSDGGTVTKKVTVQTPPTTAHYALTFTGSSEAAVLATSTLIIRVFDASQDAALCTTLVGKVKSNADLPTAVFTGDEAPLCDFFKTAGQSVDVDAGATGEIALAYGTYAFLAVGKRNGAPFIVGCGNQSSTGDAQIPVSAINSSSVPTVPTTCDTSAPLAQHCSSDPTTAAKCSP